ncbi:MAG TPA: GNAT family N-acetyltransferase [Burkholderiales bacterium]|nr:GNAT family N-acetyltransferase [Burkholderiales bacterium]
MPVAAPASKPRAAMAAVRPALPWDGADLQQFIRELSPESRHARFMMGVRELPADMLGRVLHPYPGEAAIVATAPTLDIIGLAQYAADDGGCEVALVVADAWQRQGLGTRLLGTIARLAAENGVRGFHADVLADNHKMLGLARKFGCRIATNPRAPYLVRISKRLDIDIRVAGEGR